AVGGSQERWVHGPRVAAPIPRGATASYPSTRPSAFWMNPVRVEAEAAADRCLPRAAAGPPAPTRPLAQPPGPAPAPPGGCGVTGGVAPCHSGKTSVTEKGQAAVASCPVEGSTVAVTTPGGTGKAGYPSAGRMART